MSDRSPAAPPAPDLELSVAELQRYARHITMPEVGVEGQKRLKAARVLLVGTGGLGAPVGMYLAAAGIGRIGLVDFDVVDASNLQRQVTFSTDDIGRPKLEATRERLQGINPNVQFDLHPVRLDSTNAMEILEPYDVIVDGTDNFPTRYLVNDACVLLHKPNVYGSIFRFEGQASIFWAGHGPCYRCLFPEPPEPGVVPSCAEGGVLGVLPGIIGSIQAMETIKLLLERGDSLIGRLLLFDALAMQSRQLKLRRDPHCAVCGDTPRIRQLIDYEEFCGNKPAQGEEALMQEVTAEQLHERLQQGDRPFILDVRESFEWDICNLQPQGAKLIPLGELQQRVSELERDQDIVVICRTGVRSAHAVQYLSKLGYSSVANLVGGIHAWARAVDPSMPQY